MGGGEAVGERLEVEAGGRKMEGGGGSCWSSSSDPDLRLGLELEAQQPPAPPALYSNPGQGASPHVDWVEKNLVLDSSKYGSFWNLVARAETMGYNWWII